MLSNRATIRWSRWSRHAPIGVTLEMIASHAGLGFLPVREERYDFVVPRSRTTRPGVIAFTTLLAQPSTRDALRCLGMKI
jgi:putative molybdopterin biosynthesis protein